MTSVENINFTENQNYLPYLDLGFVGFIDCMGNDSSIVQAARVSYGTGTKSVSSDESLIRYLMRHEHWTPFEMCDVKFHLKIPIFVMRQLVRHRTASINEYSGRYSVMTNECYSPTYSEIQPQSTTNKQGKDGIINTEDRHTIIDLMDDLNDHSTKLYDLLLKGIHSEYSKDIFNEQTIPPFEGMTRELARIVLPVSNYTELYWKANLRNFLHMARLRMDSHAQFEIRELANIMYELAKPYFPIACKAWEDYSLNAKTFSATELKIINRFLSFPHSKHMQEYAKELGLSERELTEFYKKLNI